MFKDTDITLELREEIFELSDEIKRLYKQIKEIEKQREDKVKRLMKIAHNGY